MTDELNGGAVRLGSDQGKRQSRGEWVRCSRCDGYGLVDGFGGPTECYVCVGGGHQWRYPSGVLAQYPGGPLAGRDASKVATTGDSPSSPLENSNVLVASVDRETPA